MTEERLVEIEMKLAFQQQSIDDLSSTLIEKERRIAQLEDQVARLEKALQVLAQRTRDGAAGGGEVLGAHPEDDPVPRSG